MLATVKEKTFFFKYSTKKGVIYMDIKNYQEALSCFNQALEMNSPNSVYLTLKGNSLKHLNRIDDALKCFDEAIRLDADYAHAYYFKSKCFWEQKGYESALNAINKACEIRPLENTYKSFRNSIQQGIY